MEIPLISQEIQIHLSDLRQQDRQEKQIPSVTQENPSFISRVTSQQIKKRKDKKNEKKIYLLNKKGSISAWDSSGLWANTDFFPTDQAPGIMDTDYVNKNMIYFGGIIQSFQPFIAVYYNPQ